MSRIFILWPVLLVFVLVQSASVAAQEPAPAGETGQLTLQAVEAAFTKVLDKRLTSIEKDIADLKKKQLNVTVSKSFYSHDGNCTDSADPPADNPAASAGDTTECEGKCCQTTWIDTKRVYTTWVKCLKKVTITKPTPYLCVEKKWDPCRKCYVENVVTKYKDQVHEVFVPCMKKVPIETVGKEKITVCLEEMPMDEET